LNFFGRDRAAIGFNDRQTAGVAGFLVLHLERLVMKRFLIGDRVRVGNSGMEILR
jgi:hypothetical protein